MTLRVPINTRYLLGAVELMVEDSERAATGASFATGGRLISNVACLKMLVLKQTLAWCRFW